MSRRHLGNAMPQELHLLPLGHRATRACGATTGGFVRMRDAAWLRRFLRDGGGLCPECRAWLLEQEGDWERVLRDAEKAARKRLAEARS